MQGEAVNFFRGGKKLLCTSLQKIVWSGEKPWPCREGRMKLKLKGCFDALRSSERVSTRFRHVEWFVMRWRNRTWTSFPASPFVGALPGPGPNESWMYGHGSYCQPLRWDQDNWRPPKHWQKGARLGAGAEEKELLFKRIVRSCLH